MRTRVTPVVVGALRTVPLSAHINILLPYPEMAIVWVSKDTEEGTRGAKEERRSTTKDVYWFPSVLS